jgi:SAM-dependent methyltransferase
MNHPEGAQLDSAYDSYLVEEWNAFHGDGLRSTALLEESKHANVENVLDIGCGAGQEMLPFVSARAIGVGIDLERTAAGIGRRMYENVGLDNKVHFLCARGEQMPFESGYFDVVICRVALMYMDNKSALAEISRVLRHEGVFFLKYHAPQYYWKKLADGLRTGQFKSSIHAARVLLAGSVYSFTGRQSFSRVSASGEIYQTARALSREFAQVGMRIRSEMPDTNPSTPSLIAAKTL